MEWEWDLLSEWILPSEENFHEIYRIMESPGIKHLFQEDEDRFIDRKTNVTMPCAVFDVGTSLSPRARSLTRSPASPPGRDMRAGRRLDEGSCSRCPAFQAKQNRRKSQHENSASAATATKRYRVVQWATGNVGARALRRAIEHPDLDLVGVWVHSADKVGRDAGELAGIAPIGIAATNRMQDVLALKPDCVLYMPHVCNYDEICQLLESGSNIVTTRMELQNPAALDAAICARIEEACQRGNSSIHATGCSPGLHFRGIADRARLDPAAAR